MNYKADIGQNPELADAIDEFVGRFTRQTCELPLMYQLALSSITQYKMVQQFFKNAIELEKEGANGVKSSKL